MRTMLRRILSRRPDKPNVTQLTPRVAVVGHRTEPRVTQLGKGGWLVRLATPAGRRLELHQLDDTTWVVQRRGPQARVVHRIGPGSLRADVLIDRGALTRNAQGYQLQMLRYLGEEHVAWLLRKLEVDVVLDVGANRGQFGRRLRRGGYTGRIVSFEPVPRVAEKLEKVAANDPDWRVMRYALGAADEETEMHVGAGQGRLSSLLPASEFGRSWDENIDADTTVPVSVRRLDGLYDEAVVGIENPRVYLKLDTQGYDLQAFAGAGERVRELVGMQSEVSQVPLYDGMPHMSEQLATYAAAGFELTGMFPVVTDRPTARVVEFDAVMVRSEPTGP